MKRHRKTILALVVVLMIAGLTLGAMVVLAQERADQSQAATVAAAPQAQVQPQAQALAHNRSRDRREGYADAHPTCRP